MFDLNLLTIHTIDGVDRSDLPGLFAANAPRRVARGRNGDQLVLLASFLDNAVYPPAELQKLLSRMAQTFFRTTGTVTAAMRAAADTFNQNLLDRNLRSAASASQLLGVLNILVIHAGRSYLGHAGPAHSLALSQNSAEHFFEISPAVKGLGVSRGTALRYYQVDLSPGDTLVLTPELPDAWMPANLPESGVRDAGLLADRLKETPTKQLLAVIVQIKEGNGEIHNPQPLAAQTTRTSQVDTAAPATTSTQAGLSYSKDFYSAHVVEEPITPPEEKPEQIEPAAQVPAPTTEREPKVSQPNTQAETRRTTRQHPTPEATQPVQRPRLTPVEAPARRPTEPAKQRKKGWSVRPVFARLWSGGRRIRQSSSKATRNFLSSLLPGQNGQPGSLTSGSMVFIAIAIPLVIVTLATMVYFQRGKSIQYQGFFNQAEQTAAQAASMSDPASIRSAWEATLVWLDKAEAYERTEQSQALRQQAQNALDAIEGITRLNFQPAIVGGLANSVDITQMVISANDLYMLDNSTGRVMRASLTSRGYEIDSNFRCEKGNFGSMKVGNLVGIAPIPRGNDYKATILALDTNGNLLYCIPGSPPLSTPLAPPETNWGKITAFTYDSGTLYVLDTQVNKVWVYGGDNGTFGNRPQSFFEDQAPQMTDVGSIAVNNMDLYLLHVDGHLTQCTLSYMTSPPTRCSDPAVLTDSRPGHAPNEPLANSPIFSSLLYTPPPDPSLFLLDPDQAAIYHFSMRLNLQRILHARGSAAVQLPNTPVTAYTVGQNRNAFIAYGNQIFYALIP